MLKRHANLADAHLNDSTSKCSSARLITCLPVRAQVYLNSSSLAVLRYASIVSIHTATNPFLPFVEQSLFASSSAMKIQSGVALSSYQGLLACVFFFRISNGAYVQHGVMAHTTRSDATSSKFACSTNTRNTKRLKQSKITSLVQASTQKSAQQKVTRRTDTEIAWAVHMY